MRVNRELTSFRLCRYYAVVVLKFEAQHLPRSPTEKVGCVLTCRCHVRMSVSKLEVARNAEVFTLNNTCKIWQFALQKRPCRRRFTPPVSKKVWRAAVAAGLDCADLKVSTVAANT